MKKTLKKVMFGIFMILLFVFTSCSSNVNTMDSPDETNEIVSPSKSIYTGTGSFGC